MHILRKIRVLRLDNMAHTDSKWTPIFVNIFFPTSNELEFTASGRNTLYWLANQFCWGSNHRAAYNLSAIFAQFSGRFEQN